METRTFRYHLSGTILTPSIIILHRRAFPHSSGMHRLTTTSTISQDEQKPSISQSAQWVSFGTWSHARQRKTGMNISWDEVQAHITTTKDANRDRKDDEMRTSATQPNVQEPQQLSIAEVTRLIESGQIHLIPNTRTIPEHLNVRQSFVSVSVFQNTPIMYPLSASLWLLGSTTQSSTGTSTLQTMGVIVVSPRKEFRSDSPANVSACGLTAPGSHRRGRSMESGSTHRKDGWWP